MSESDSLTSSDNAPRNDFSWKGVFAGVIFAVVAWLPAVVTIVFVDESSVNIPVWDDFERIPLLEKYEAGELTLGFLISPHIEHRILIPRLIILANYEWGGGDIRNEVWVILGSLLMTSMALAALVLRTRGARASSWLIVFLINLTIFSLIQYQNLCWAIQTAFVLPLMFLALTLLTLHSRWPSGWRFGLCVLWAMGATFCFTHGLVLWLLVFGYFLLSPDFASMRSRVVTTGIWGAVAAAVFGLYFHDLSSTSHPVHSYFQAPGATPPGLEGILVGANEVERVKGYAMNALGSQFSRYVFAPPKEIAPVTGAVQLVLFVLAAATGVGVCLARRDKESWRDLLPWMALGGYVLVTVLIMALGRSHMGLGRSMSPRYISITLYLTVALLVLLPLVVMLVSRKGVFRSCCRAAGYLAAGMFLGLQVWNGVYGAVSLRHWCDSRWQSLMPMSFYRFSESEHIWRADQNAKVTRNFVERLHRLDVAGSLPKPFGPGDFERFKVSRLVLNEARAEVSAVEAILEPFEGWALRGVASARPKMPRVPDGILFTVSEGGERTIVGYGELESIMPFHIDRWDTEFVELRHQTERDRSAWTARLARENLPEGVALPVELEVWGIDFEANRLYPFASTFVLE
ncbi:MAG: hypothetical protein AAGJ79_04485 [Verrucomicrobiota bacterium]